MFCQDVGAFFKAPNNLLRTRICKRTRTPVFTLAFLTVAGTRGQGRVLDRALDKKPWPVCRVEYHAATSNHETPPFGTSRMDLESSMLSEKRQTERRSDAYDVPRVWGTTLGHADTDRTQGAGDRGQGGGTWRGPNIQPQFGWGAAAVGWGALSAIHRSGIQKCAFQPWVVLLPSITSVHLVKH